MVIERFLCWVDSAPEEKRAQSAVALAKAYLCSSRHGEEQEMAEAAISVLVDDRSPQVRYALAQAFAAHPGAPRHVLASLAADTVEIATLVLASSPVFLDSELFEFVASGRPEVQIAIACRAEVSAQLAAAFAEHAELDAVRALLTNLRADISSASLHRIAERFGDDAQIRRLLLRNDGLRPRTRLLLIDRIGDAMEAAAREDGDVPARRVGRLNRESSDKAAIAYAARVCDADLAEIVDSLIASGRMTTSFLLRTICMGNIALFARALATLAAVPPARVEAALSNDRRGVLRAICRKAGIPERACDVFVSAIDAWRRALDTPEPAEADRLAYRVTRDVLTSYHGSDDPCRDPLLALLRKLAAEAARDHARREAKRIAAAARQPALPALPSPEESPAEETAMPEVIDLPQEVVTAFAYYLAEEIADLEEEFAAMRNLSQREAISGEVRSADVGKDEPRAALQIDEGNIPVVPEHAANDDVPATEPPVAVIDRFRSYIRLRAAA